MAYDNIPDAIIKMAKENHEFQLLLWKSINQILWDLDGSWFTGRVVFLKKDDIQNTSYDTCRPIAIMSPIAKLIEAIALIDLEHIKSQPWWRTK